MKKVSVGQQMEQNRRKRKSNEELEEERHQMKERRVKYEK